MAKNVSKKNNNHRQKFLAVVALVGLFASGLMVGLAFTRVKYVEKHVPSMSGIDNSIDNNTRVCEKIESEMTNQICGGCAGADNHIGNAKIYAVLAERGCPENTQKYVDLAKQELSIARALEDDKFSQGETLEVVETYKKLQMQAAAEEVFDKAKRLTNPAIDFILQVEKIINE